MQDVIHVQKIRKHSNCLAPPKVKRKKLSLPNEHEIAKRPIILPRFDLEAARTERNIAKAIEGHIGCPVGVAGAFEQEQPQQQQAPSSDGLKKPVSKTCPYLLSSYQISMNRFLLVLTLTFYSTLLMAQIMGNRPFGVEINANREGYRLIDTFLEGKKMVLLGELDHGDGSSFVVKTDLIKYLHEELGFNTLIFEASFINCGFLWADIRDSSKFNSKLKHSIYNIWSEVEETRELFRYIEEQHAQGTPLKIAGIDPQFSGIENTQEFVSVLENTLPTQITKSNSFFEFIHDIGILSTWMRFPGERDCKLSEDKFSSYCDTILEAAKKLDVSKTNLSLWQMYMDNVRTLGKIKRKRDDQSFEIRDKQMFDNAAYLFEQNPDEKFIIWAANAHIIRKDYSLKKRGRKFYLIGSKKLGDYLYEHYAPSLYAVAVTSGKGATLDFLNPTQQNILNTPKRNSLEGLMYGLTTLLVDLKRFEMALGLDQYESQLFYTNIVCIAKWSRHIDGIIYIPEMNPSTPLWQNNRR